VCGHLMECGFDGRHDAWLACLGMLSGCGELACMLLLLLALCCTGTW
jgi:hypothetical protein